MSNLRAMATAVTDGADINGPGAISRRGQQVGAAALEVEVPPVKAPIMAPAPGHAGSRALRDPDTTQKTTSHQRRRL